MLRTLKTLGIAVVAVSAVFASAAQAQFTAESYPTTITATSAAGNDVLTIGGSSLGECSGHFEGSFDESTTALTITPAYSNCKFFGFASSTFTMNGCDYVFHSNGGFDIECPAGKAITITGGNCEVDIPGQTDLEAIQSATNQLHIDTQLKVASMTANVTKDGFLCPLNGTGHQNATYTQAIPVTFKPVSGGARIWVH